MPTFVTLDPAEPLESAAAILALIAWPDHIPDGEHLTQAQTALVAHMLRALVAADPTWESNEHNLKPVYLLMDPNAVDRTVRKTSARIQDVLKAARVARPFVASIAMSEPPALPQQVARLSLNAVIPFAVGDSDTTDLHNFEQRVFRRAFPVLHLALALEQSIDEFEADTGHPPSLEWLMVAPGFVPWFVERARQLEPIVLAIREFKVPEERLVTLRLA